MKKTALQQLIDSWKERKPNGSYGLIWQAFIDEATEFLETERDQSVLPQRNVPMTTREEAEKRALELFPNGEKVMEKYTSTIQREAFLQCFDEMQQNRHTCGFCVTPEKENE